MVVLERWERGVNERFTKSLSFVGKNRHRRSALGRKSIYQEGGYLVGELLEVGARENAGGDGVKLFEKLVAERLAPRLTAPLPSALNAPS